LLEKKKNKIPAKKSGEARKAKGQKGRGLGGRNFCPPSLSDSDFFPPPLNFVFRFAKCTANKEVVFAPPTRAHTTKTPLLKLKKRCILIIRFQYKLS